MNLETMRARFAGEFGASGWLRLAEAPGRVNLIGEHTDYNGLPVFPMAIQRRMRILFRERADACVRLVSADGYPPREFAISRDIEPYAAGDWGNYAKASAQALARRVGALRGIDAVVSGDIPAAAGLSSSSALVVAAAQALAAANGRALGFAEWMELLPEGEQYVGTRGGAMDHAVCLAGAERMALKIDFAPLAVHPTPVPSDWTFVVGHSLVRAEKSGAAREAYNSRREACGRAAAGPAEKLTGEDRRRWRHVVSEAARVEQAQAAMRAADLERFGALMSASHASLRDDFEVSHPEVDRLVEAFLAAGAAGARVTGAGFGGCAVALARADACERVKQAVERSFYATRPQHADFGEYLITAIPSAGARVLDL